MAHSTRRLLAALRQVAVARPALWEAGLLAALGLGLTAIGLSGIWSGLAPLALEVSGWWHLAAILPACAALLAKRRRPLTVLVAVSVLFAADLLIGGSLAMLLVFWDALYAAAYFGSSRARKWLLRTIVAAVVGMTVIAAFSDFSLQFMVFAGLQAFALLVTPYWWATAVRQKSELAELAEQRADDLSRMAELREKQVVREERARMARDLHDVIAGQLSAIAIHSEAALSHPESAASDRAALHAIRSTSVTSLTEMRSMIMLLRDGREPAETIGGLDRIADLYSKARATGLTIVESSDEVPAALPAVVDQAAARILQEALTNASRHAAGGTAVVELREGRGMLQIRVASRPRLGTAPATSSPDGIGVLTMKERAAAVGGTLAAGWNGDNTEWLVTTELPLVGTA